MSDNLVPIGEIHYNQAFNCRGEIVPIDVVDLAKDIEKNGLLQPVVLSKYSEMQAKATEYKYLLIAGYRRYTAHIVLKRSKIKANILGSMSEVDACFLNLSENTQRKDLNVLQEARAMQRLFDLGVSEDNVSERLGKSRGWVQVRFILLKLPLEIQEECAAGVFNHLQIRDIYTHFKTDGKEVAFEVVRKMKDAKTRGRSIRVQKKTNQRKNAKRHRKRPEIFEMMDHVQENFGNSSITRTLAWAAGEISDYEYYTTLKNQDPDGTYVIPKLKL